MPNYSSATGGIVSPDLGTMVPTKNLDSITNSPKVENTDGLDFLLNLSKRLEKEDEATDRRFHQKWLKVAKFYEGEHLGRFDSQGRWRSYQPQPGDPYYVHPEMRFHSDAITAAWTQSRPDIRILPAADDDRTVSAARKAEQIIDHYETLYMTEEFLQRECKLGQFTGQMYRYTWWDSSLGPIVPRYEFGAAEQEVDSGGLECSVCGMRWQDGEVGPECPECGGQVQQVPPTTIQIPQQQEVGRYHIGDINVEGVPAFQIKVDRSHGTFALASFLRRRRMVRPEVIKELFPSWEPPTKGAESDYFLRSERLLQQSVGTPPSNVWRMNVLSQPNKGVIVNQWWFAPCMYAARGPELQDIGFVGGQVIPAGVKLIDIFPTGIYILIIDEKILDIREEYLHDHWQHSPFISVPTRVEGDGIEDLLEPARQLDDLMSLVYIDAKANACPPTIVNTSYGLKTTDISGKPHWVIPARVPTGENIGNAIWQGGNRQTPMGLYRLIDMLKAEQQLLAKSFSPVTGAPDMVTNGNAQNTATSAQLATSAAQSQRAPELAMRAHGTMIWARQVLKLFQKNAVDAHYIPKQGRFGLLEGQLFKGADIEADFIFTVRNRSWIPRDEFSRRSDLLGAIQAGIFNPSLPRVVRDEMAETFNIDISLSTDIADIRIARMRLEQMKQLMKQLESEVGDPVAMAQFISQAVPIEPLIDNHMVMREWYIDVLKTDEGLMFPPPLREAVKFKVLEHEQAMVMQTQREMMLQIQGQAPMLAMQQQQQQDERDNQAAEADKQREHDLKKSELQAQSKKEKDIS